MGGHSYSVNLRSVRASTQGYATKHIDDIFEQNKKREIHESMDPKGAKMREARDSDVHPNSLPIIIALDVTGSMGRIPHQLIKEGLPKLVSGITEKGIPDPAVLFLAIGDSKYDSFPLQVAQFESGDEQLDMWLTRTYLEGGGGGNNGESYSLAWLFGAYHTVTDNWEKRHQKGFLFTIGDEHCHSTISAHELKEVMGENSEKTLNSAELLREAQKKWNVYHLHLTESGGEGTIGSWKELMGKNCVEVKDYNDIPNVISGIVTANAPKSTGSVPVGSPKPSKRDDDPVHVDLGEEELL